MSPIQKENLASFFAGAKDEISGKLVNKGGLMEGTAKGLKWFSEEGLLR